MFAPTFRIGKNYQYYDLGMEVESLAAELKKHNLYVITKKHHILNAVFMDKGIDTSGVHTSSDNHFIVDEEYDFYQLVAAADCFATDYSSSMYYAFIMNLPVFLYARFLLLQNRLRKGLLPPIMTALISLIQNVIRLIEKIMSEHVTAE